MSHESETDRKQCMKINWGDCFRVLTFRKPTPKDQHDRNQYQQLAPQVRYLAYYFGPRFNERSSE